MLERSRSVSRVGRILEILISAKTIVASLALYWMVRELIALVHVRGTGNTHAPEIQAVVAAGRFVFIVNTPLLFATIFVWLIWQFFVHDLVVRTTGPFRFGRWASVGWWFSTFGPPAPSYPFKRKTEIFGPDSPSPAMSPGAAFPGRYLYSRPSPDGIGHRPLRNRSSRPGAS